MLTFTATKSYPRKFIREKSAPDLIHVREARSSGFIIVVSFIKLKNYLSSIYFREFSLRTLRAILFNLLDGGPIDIGISKLILYFVTLLLMRHYWNLDHSLAIALQKTSVRSTPIIHFAGQKTIWRRAVLKLVSVTCSNDLRDADGNADFRESHNYQIYLLWLFGALHLTKNSRHDYSVADYGKANSRLKGQNATIAVHAEVGEFTVACCTGRKRGCPNTQVCNACAELMPVYVLRSPCHRYCGFVKLRS